MLNKVMIIGRLGKDPELKYTQNGYPICNMSVATDESYVDNEGNKVQRTEWHSVVAYQKQAENCSKYLGKGSLAYFEGSLQTRKWQDQEGNDRYKTEIKAFRVQFLDRKEQRPQDDSRHEDQTAREQNQSGQQNQSQTRGPAKNQGMNANQSQGQPRLPGTSRQGGYDEFQEMGYVGGMDDVPF
jgi:single-strand DNA-binding protein